MKIYTLEEIYLYHKARLMLHQPRCIITDAANMGYTVKETVEFLLNKGYNKTYLEEELQILRHLQLIAPWEPD